MGAAQKYPVVIADELLKDEITESVIEIFNASFSIDVKLESFIKAKSYALVGDVSGMVGMVQESIDGNLAISFFLPVISKILSKLYKTEFSAVNEDVRQGTAELANMIYGRLKVKLNGRGYDLQMSLPTVVTGKGHTVHHDPGDVAVLKFVFEDKYRFEVIISCHGRKGK